MLAVGAAGCGGSSTPAPALEVACTGASCGASSASRYSGSGIGIWQYRNATGAPVQLDIAIGGVTSLQKPVLIFSNGGAANRSLPDAGTLAVAPAAAMRDPLLASAFPSDADVEREARHRAEWEMTEQNRELGSSLPHRSLVAASAFTPPSVPLPPDRDPAIDGTVSYTWDDTSVSKYAPHPATALAKCDLPDLRKAIFWVDQAAWKNSTADRERLASFRNAFCGSAPAPGGYARVTGLRGAPWGAEAKWAGFIQDEPAAPQSIHVVFLDLKGRMGGYFHSVNPEKLSADRTRSNQALAIFIDSMGPLPETPTVPPTDDRVPFQAASVATMVHELAHLVNYYQRSVTRSSPYDTWLEEMSAMMTEDIVPATITTPPEYTVVDQFIVPYLQNGGGVSLINWGYLGSDFYNLGGSLGAFLNRRYGTAVYTGMLNCSGDKVMTGHACVDSLIRQNGGAGLDDEFARLGATMYGLLPVTGAPAGYGFPQKLTSGYTLPAIDVSASTAYRRASAKSLENAFQATSHTFVADTIPERATTYSRSGVVVPPETTVLLVIQPPVTFTLSAASTALQVTRGGSAETAITVPRGEGAGSVGLYASVEPVTNLVTAEMKPSAVQSGGSSTLKVKAAADAPVGTYTVTVTGTSVTHQQAAIVTVTVAAP
jgi:hypothetical protein